MRAELRCAVVDVLAEMGLEAPRPLLTQGQLAKHLGCSERTVYTLRERGLPVVWLLESPRFELAACLAWLGDQTP